MHAERTQPWLGPRAVDGILALLLVELVAIAAILHDASALVWITPWLLYLASGGFLLLALRVALGSAEPQRIAGALLASGLAHGALLAWLVGSHPFGVGGA